MVSNTQAIVLRTQKYRDYDVQMVLLSRELGKIQTVAYGARKRNSKLMPFCQIFNLGIVSLNLSSAKYWVVRQAQSEIMFRHIKQDNLKFAAACFYVDALSSLLAFQQQDKKLFDLLKGYLYALDTLATEYCTGIQVVFLLRLFRLCGYSLPLDSMTSSQSELIAFPWLDLTKDKLRPGMDTEVELTITPEDWWQLQALNHFSFGSDEFPLKLNSDVLVLLEEYLLSIIEFQPKSMSFYRQIRGF